MTRPERPIAADWLALRRAADTAARDRASELVAAWVAAAGGEPLTIIDIGAGTGANRAYLAPRLPPPVRWVLLDHDAALLAASDAGDAERVLGGISDLREVIGTHGVRLLTCSALLDLLTGADLDEIADVLVTHRVPALFSLTVDGSIGLDPPHPHDGVLSAAFNEHQARDGRPGCTAASYLADRCEQLGLRVQRAETPWLLDATVAPLITRLLTERIAAAVETRPELAAVGAEWLAVRLGQLRQGGLRLRVGHVDLLITPGIDG